MPIVNHTPIRLQPRSPYQDGSIRIEHAVLSRVGNLTNGRDDTPALRGGLRDFEALGIPGAAVWHLAEIGRVDTHRIEPVGRVGKVSVEVYRDCGSLAHVGAGAFGAGGGEGGGEEGEEAQEELHCLHTVSATRGWNISLVEREQTLNIFLMQSGSCL